MTAAANLQDRLTAVILSDPDVHTIYPPRPALGALASQLPGGIGDQWDKLPKVVVSETGDGIAVTVSVGVTGEHPAPIVCRNLHDRIAAELSAERTNRPISIAVKIASIA